MSNSNLVSYTAISPNRNSPRNHTIDRVSIHCVVGQCSVQSLGNVFASKSKGASSNYGIGYDGKIGMYVEEKDRSWCTSSASNDNRAVTIEVASDTYHPYKVTSAAYDAILDLVTDICKRNGKTKILWFGDKEKTLAYQPKSNEMVMTVHRWFANKACPGDYLYGLHPTIAAEVNKRLSGGVTEAVEVNYQVKVTEKVGLNCRSEPVYGSVLMTYPYGSILTITKESDGWGFTGTGWVSLQYTQKIQAPVPQTPQEQPTQQPEGMEDDDMDLNRFTELMNEYRATLRDNDAGSWSEESRKWAIDTGLVKGGGTLPNGEPNYMWEDLPTRETLVEMMYRLAKMVGIA